MITGAFAFPAAFCYLRVMEGRSSPFPGRSEMLRMLTLSVDNVDKMGHTQPMNILRITADQATTLGNIRNAVVRGEMPIAVLDRAERIIFAAAQRITI